MKNRFIIKIIVILSIFLVGCSDSNNNYNETREISEFIYVASKKSEIYHLPKCEWANKINDNNLIVFQNKVQAQVAGYRECKICGANQE